jgi:eukaryotic-like serine/threonine-protein kinase
MRLAHYEISSLLGKGGMGEVWRARDTKLGRDVAIKVLPDEFTRDLERLARFGREARVLASLDHPSVAAIFGLEEVDGTRFLVMQLADGEDLSERLRRGPMPVDEAIAVAARIAEALEAAHEKGIVHRDLKPANVKVTADNHVRVLDFGLAKALDSEDGDPDPSNSPTMVRAATHAGIILGTAAYMSPEQARGKSVDRRADIWAFGVLLWEMLTGRRMFLGETVSDTLAAVLTRNPDLNALPPDTPERVRWVVRRCLERDPRKRLRDIGEARVALIEPDPVSDAPATRAAASEVAPAGGWRWVALASLLAAVALAAILVVRQLSSGEVLYVNIPLPPDTHLALSGIQPGPPAISRDGKQIAFVGEGKVGVRRVWVRRIDEPKARMIPDTDGASYPFFSWDGDHIGFFAQQKLKRVPVAGGSVLTVADAPAGKGGSWSRDDVIIFSPSFNGPVYRVSATGGPTAPLTAIDLERGDSSHRFPQFMDDGKHFTWLVRRRTDTDNIVLFRGLDSGEETLVANTETNALVVSGTMLYLRDRMLMAQRFDQKQGVLSGAPVPLAEGVKVILGAARMVVAAGPGMIAYQTGSIAAARRLMWIDRSGAHIEQLGDVADYDDASISPDASRVAVEVSNPREGTFDIWVIDAESGIRERLTFEPTNEIDPVWSPDSRRVAYASNQNGPYEIMVKDVGGGSEPSVLVPNSALQARIVPQDWPSRDEMVYISEDLASGTTTIWLRRLDREGDAEKIGSSTTRTPAPRVSPDGRWLAYSTGLDASAPGIVVVDYPEAKRRWEVARGSRAFWNRNGRELFFLDIDGSVASVEVRSREGSFEWGPPRLLFPLSETWIDGTGDRFLVREPLAATDASAYTFQAILGWESLAR